MKKTVCSLILAAFCGSAAAVEPQAYFGVGVGRVDFSATVGSFSLDANPTALSFMVGSQINDWLGAEVRAGLTNEDEVEISGFGGSGVDVSLDYYAGLYARATIPTQTFIRPYAIAGFTYAEATAEAPGISESDDESDFSFGAGIELGNPNGLHFAGEYMRYFDKDGVEISALNIWLVSAF